MALLLCIKWDKALLRQTIIKEQPQLELIGVKAKTIFSQDVQIHTVLQDVLVAIRK
ncbi:hypothetical protein [Arcobacter sp.]|uniref:hypothetical protein n=1 Tax=unclassified Arcobacter TaxID=2593671 RepID=UPI003B00DB27